MADEVEMTPVAAAEPPKSDPLASPAAPPKPAASLVAKPVIGAGIKLPPKPSTALKPGLKLPTQNAMRPGLKLPTQNGLKPGVRLPPKPVIRRPGATVVASPLPKPVVSAAASANPAPAAPAPAAPAPAPAAPAPAPAAAAPAAPASAAGDGMKPLSVLKTITQTLKGITQEIPAQAILRKTGIIAEGAMSEAQKEAAKHKTARISLSDAIGVAPVKNENAPIKTIRIKRPVDISGGSHAPSSAVPAASANPAEAASGADAASSGSTGAQPTMTQRKTLKISRPGSGGMVRPAKFGGVKRPAAATTAAAGDKSAAAADGAVSEIADIADIPDMPPVSPMPVSVGAQSEGPAWLWTLSSLLQIAACVAMGALAWLLYQNSVTEYF